MSGLAAFVAGGTHLADLVLAVLVLEAVWLAAHRRRTGRGLAAPDWLGLLGAGFCLTLALRLALAGAPPGAIAVALLGAFVAHLADLRRRWTRGGAGRIT